MSAASTQEAKKTSVTEYLETLVWDGTARIDRWLIDYADTRVSVAQAPHLQEKLKTRET